MYEVIVVWSCELLQQLSNVMIAGESWPPPPAAHWIAHGCLGTITQDHQPMEEHQGTDRNEEITTDHCCGLHSDGGEV